MIYRHKGLIMADYILNKTIYELADRFDEIEGHVEGFNNCREQGYILCVRKNNDAEEFDPHKHFLSVYIYNNRHTDMPSLTWDYAYTNKLYSEEAYEDRTECFATADEAVERLVNMIENFEIGRRI